MTYTGIPWEPCFGHTGRHWLAWLAGRLFRLRHGPTPAVPEWNGASPYCKALDLGLDQDSRIEWEIGWEAEHGLRQREGKEA